MSRDQGWSVFPNQHGISHPPNRQKQSTDIRNAIGTYSGLCSWFEVCAERPKSISPGDFEPLVDTEVLSETGDFESHDSRWERISATGGHDRGSTSDPGEKKTWVLQRNVHAGKDWKTHCVVWKHHGPDSGPVNENTGAGMGGDLLRCLKPGDRINLVARAWVIGHRSQFQSIIN